MSKKLPEERVAYFKAAVRTLDQGQPGKAVAMADVAKEASTHDLSIATLAREATSKVLFRAGINFDPVRKAYRDPRRVGAMMNHLIETGFLDKPQPDSTYYGDMATDGPGYGPLEDGQLYARPVPEAEPAQQPQAQAI